MGLGVRERHASRSQRTSGCNLKGHGKNGGSGGRDWHCSTSKCGQVSAIKAYHVFLVSSYVTQPLGENMYTIKLRLLGPSNQRMYIHLHVSYLIPVCPLIQSIIQYNPPSYSNIQFSCRFTCTCIKWVETPRRSSITKSI